MANGPSKNFMDGRPHKAVFQTEKQHFILEEMKKWISNNLPPNTEIYEQRIFGSMAKGTFGKYQTEFKGRKFSDVDILFVVDDDFKPPVEWIVQFECVKDVWIVYDVAKVPIKVENKTILVDVQYIILKKSFAEKTQTIKEAEKWGIPLNKTETKNQYISLL